MLLLAASAIAIGMPRKQRKNRASGQSGRDGTAATPRQSSATSSRTDDGGGFPTSLLGSHCGHRHRGDDSPEALVPNAVYVARNVLSPKECREWIKYAEEGGRWDAVSHPATKWIAHRECGRIQKNDWQMSHRLYQRIETVVQQVSPQLDIFDRASLQSNEAKYKAIAKSGDPPTYGPFSCNPNLRLYKYTRGQWFGRHVDESNEVDLAGSGGGSDAPFFASDVKEARTEITVLFYLSSCRGGATRFHLPRGKGSGSKRTKGGGEAPGANFVPEEGAALLHVHGDRCLEHEAEPVLEGVKYVLRTDVVYGIL